jgi:hypothetical protein
MKLSVTKALYGHIARGKCITEDLGFLGCQVDVSQLLRQKCDEKPVCSVEVDSKNLLDVNPCRRGLSVYLDVLHACIKGNAIVYISSYFTQFTGRFVFELETHPCMVYFVQTLAYDSHKDKAH